MADDIFLTPEEQDERARKWLKENGPALAIGIALGLGAIFGWNQYKESRQTSAENASVIYADVIEDIRASELANIDAQLMELKNEFADSPYAAKAAMLKAKQLSVGDLPAAYDELQWVKDNTKEFGLKHTARIRQAKIKLSLGELDAARDLASHTPTQGFESNYAELLGDIAIKAGDPVLARKQYQTAIDTLPESQRGYSQILSIKLDRLPQSEAVEAQSKAISEESAVAPTPATSITEQQAATEEASAVEKTPVAEETAVEEIAVEETAVEETAVEEETAIEEAETESK